MSAVCKMVSERFVSGDTQIDCSIGSPDDGPSDSVGGAGCSGCGDASGGAHPADRTRSREITTQIVANRRMVICGSYSYSAIGPSGSSGAKQPGASRDLAQILRWLPRLDILHQVIGGQHSGPP